MDSHTLLIGLAGLVLGLLLGAAAVAAVSARRTGDVRSRLAAAQARAEALEAEAAAWRERSARDAAAATQLAPVRESLGKLEENLSLLERERIEQYATLASQLTENRRVHGELMQTTAALASAMTTASARGMWGELELRRVVEAAGMLRHVDFETQVSVAGGRPDMLIQLPGGHAIPLDAKVPLDAYLRAMEAGDPGPDLASHAAAFRGHVAALIKRNYHGALAADATVMFVPSEALLSAALEQDPTLLEFALRHGISPVGPAGLLPLLRAIGTLWTHQDVSQQAAELLQVGRQLYQRLGVVAGHMDAVGRSLTSAVASYNKMVSSVESRLLVTARSVDALAEEAPSVTPINPDAAQVRQFTQPETQRPA